MKTLHAHTAENGSRIFWVPNEDNVISIGMLRWPHVKTKTELLTMVLYHAWMVQNYSRGSKDWGKQVRSHQGMLRLWSAPHSVSALIHTNIENFSKQLRVMDEIFADKNITEEMFVSTQAQLTYSLQQSDQHAQAKMKLITSLHMFEAFKPYLSSQRDLGLDIGTLDYESFITGIKKIQKTPLTIVVFGGTQSQYEQTCAFFEKKKIQKNEVELYAPFESNQIDRHLSDDPEAVNALYFSLQTKTTKEFLFLEILTELMKTTFHTDSQISVQLDHAQSSSYLGVEKAMPITDIAEHVETMWGVFIDASKKVPNKEELQQALLSVQSKFAAYLQDAESFIRYQIGQHQMVITPELVHQLETFNEINVSEWMEFVSLVFQFEKQHWIEVVPRVYGTGASSDLRFESLKKRLGLKNDQKQNYLADQYRFETFIREKDASIQPQYAHQVSITENLSVVSNVVPASTLAHITVYFEG
ncbi:MAG: hypothetical protein KDD46_08245, partial [Bdellovibrionales bacterium]|nr:hypothetical protein [Bdellovibrionales bacterium]